MLSLLIAFQHSGYVQHGIFTFPALALLIGLLFSYWLSLEVEARKVAYGSSVSYFVAWNAVREVYVARLSSAVVVRKLEVFSYSKASEFPPVVLY